MRKSWKKLRNEENYNKVKQYLKGTVFYPKGKDIFKCFEFFELEDTKAVFLFEAPYRNNNATGIAMGSKVNNLALDVIKDGLSKDLCDIAIEEYFDNSLEHWAKQGILLLNMALTIPEKGDHNELWYWFIRAIIEELDKKKTLFVLFGKAKAYEYFIHNNKVITSISPTETVEAIKANKWSDDIDEKVDFRKKGLFKKINNEIDIQWLLNNKKSNFK